MVKETNNAQYGLTAATVPVSQTFDGGSITSTDSISSALGNSMASLDIANGQAIARADETGEVLRAPAGSGTAVDWNKIKMKLLDGNVERNRLVVGVSSGVLFDMRHDHEILHRGDLDAFKKFERENQHVPLEPGGAFPLVKKLLALNENLEEDASVEVVVISKNHPETSNRIFNSINHYNLPILRGSFTGGEPPYGYAAKSYGVQLYLSTNKQDVVDALNYGIGAADVISPFAKDATVEELDKFKELRLAFDGDAVLFSDESEQINQQQGMEAFYEHESENAEKTMNQGPIKPFLEALQSLEKHTIDKNKPLMKVGVFTARSAPANSRVINTLMDWSITIDEVHFLGGLNKTKFLNEFRPDMFFDDSPTNCERAAGVVTTAHVPHGVLNR